MTTGHKRALQVGLRIFICFWFASAGWLCWLYRLSQLESTLPLEALTLVFGYLMQAVGIGAYMLVGRRHPPARLRRAASCACVLYALLLVPSVLTSSLTVSLAFGCTANAFYGFFAAEYLRILAMHVDAPYRATTFGVAYAASTLASWLVSLPAQGALTREYGGIALFLLLMIPSTVLLWKRVPVWPQANKDAKPNAAIAIPTFPKELKDPAMLLIAATIVLLSLVKNVGYSLPANDIGTTVNLELSRVLYGIGLVIAGFVSDKDRRIGALCCFCALIMPFVSLSLVGSDAPSMLVWCVDYLLFGFFSVYRVVFAVDMSAQASRWYLAGAGLMLGRIGDALGTAICLGLEGARPVLICLAALLFALTAMAFFLLYQRLYLPTEEVKRTEEELFELFAMRHDLTAREGEVLRLVLDERSNTQIAAELFVSENTVKYHIRNLLRKTGCKSKREIRAHYLSDAHLDTAQ